jgi:hypothetical protein
MVDKGLDKGLDKVDSILEESTQESKLLDIQQEEFQVTDRHDDDDMVLLSSYIPNEHMIQFLSLEDIQSLSEDR